MSERSPSSPVYPLNGAHNHITFVFTFQEEVWVQGFLRGHCGCHCCGLGQSGSGQDFPERAVTLTDRLPLRGALTHQDVTVSFSEFSEGLGDLLPCFGLLEVPVY